MHIIRLSILLFFIVLLVPINASAHCKGKHIDYAPHCDGGTEPPDPGDTGDDPVYTVTIEVDMTGHSGAENWRAGFGGKNSIGLNDALPDGFDVGTISDLGLLSGVSFSDEEGGYCFQSNVFPSGFPTDDFKIHQAYVKRGKGGRAESKIWLHGFTKSGDLEVLYVLTLYGLFDPEKDWPPPEGDHEVAMSDWDLTIERGSKEIENNSCTGEGDANVVITVTAVQ